MICGQSLGWLIQIVALAISIPDHPALIYHILTYLNLPLEINGFLIDFNFYLVNNNVFCNISHIKFSSNKLYTFISNLSPIKEPLSKHLASALNQAIYDLAKKVKQGKAIKVVEIK